MKLSTGKVAFTIEFDNGENGFIYFNPSDPDLMVRMRRLNDNVMSRVKGIEDLELTNDGKPVEESKIDAFDKKQSILKEELDKAFGGSVSDVVFKHCSPFAIVDGEYFVVQFIEAIMPEIEKHVEKSNADAEKRMAKHLEKYRR